MRIDRIKSHFEDEAKQYDAIIQTLIPNYNQMIDALISIIPFSAEQPFDVIDLGCGTGTISKAIIERFPNASITCVDIAQKMLEIARNKLNCDATMIEADFNGFAFPKKYNLIVSSLALHHLESDSDKQRFYDKIHAALESGGVFINIDVVLGSDEFIQAAYMQKWQAFMLSNISEHEMNSKWLPNYYAEDRPARLTTHLNMLTQSGFSCIDVVYKYYNFAVYTAKK